MLDNPADILTTYVTADAFNSHLYNVEPLSSNNNYNSRRRQFHKQVSQACLQARVQKHQQQLDACTIHTSLLTPWFRNPLYRQ